MYRSFVVMFAMALFPRLWQRARGAEPRRFQQSGLSDTRMESAPEVALV